MKTNFIPSFRPPYGTTKTVLLTLAERKEIERKKLADHVGRMIASYLGGAIVKSHGMYYSYWVTEWGFRLSMSGHRMSTSEEGFPTFEEFTQHLFDKHGSCELRRLGKMTVQRFHDARSLKNK